MFFKIKLADVTIGVRSLYDGIFEMCRDYISEQDASFTVSISQSDIDFERKKSADEAAFERRPPVEYPDPYLETLAVYRKIAAGLLDHNVMLMHGSAVCAGGQAYLFTAPSGVGKTTHSRLWLENIEGSFIINGDKPLIKVSDACCTVYGTPWAGKEGVHQNTSAPLKAVCFLGRGAENSIAEVGFSEIVPYLFQQVHRPASPDAMRKTMNLIKEFGTKVKFYRLACNMEPQAALTAYEGMNNG